MSQGVPGEGIVRHRRRTTRGNILAITLIILLLAAVVATGLASLAHFHFRMTSRYEIYKDEFEVAEAVLAKTYAHIRFLVDNAGMDFDPATLSTIEPPVFKNYTVSDFSIDEKSSGTSTATEGPWKDIPLQTACYQIRARVHKGGATSARFEHPGVLLRQDLELRFVPLHRFAVFYDSDLEIHPGPDMTIDGRVHTNSNLYVTAGSTLTFQDYVTVVRQILHDVHPDSGLSAGTGDVLLWDGTQAVSMQPGEGGWLDHPDSNWATESQDRWNGYVYDESHNVGNLPLPIPPGEDPHVIIERASATDSPSLQREKFENKAGLKILRNPGSGVVEGFDQAGNPVSLTYDNEGVPDSIYSEATFYDQREKKWVQAIDVDVSKMNQSGILPANGILYISNEGANGVVRVSNAQELPNAAGVGFAVASDDAVYLKGDFNTVNKTYALVAGDAVMIQSNAWDDAKSVSTDISVRKASETTVNAVFFQGIVPTQMNEGVGKYSGGVESYFRLMENWTNTNLRFAGSLICLWDSQKWTGWWRDWPVYRPPDRIWSWDADLAAGGPPGMPRVYEVRRRHWHARDLGG